MEEEEKKIGRKKEKAWKMRKIVFIATAYCCCCCSHFHCCGPIKVVCVANLARKTSLDTIAFNIGATFTYPKYNNIRCYTLFEFPRRWLNGT